MTDAPPMLASDPAAPGAQRAFRILIADDNRDEVLTLATLLREEKYDVRQVYRGDAVVNLASAFLPDVALLDIGMPGMTGYDVARNLRETLGENCPVLIAITGWSKGADRVLGTVARFDHHLTKPFAIDRLLPLLASLRYRKA